MWPLAVVLLLLAAARSPTTSRPHRYLPHSPAAEALFLTACRAAGVPEAWATSYALHELLRRESAGVVGRPNYSYGARASDPARWPEVHAELRAGKRTTASSATGLGQLLLRNVDLFYPGGRAGIGDPLAEAVGMLRYIESRYRTPENAWAQYGKNHEGY